MPNKPAAAKALRQTKKHTARNRSILGKVEAVIRLARKAVVNKSNEAAKLIKDATRALDKAAQKGVITKNTAARKKSRLAKSFRALKS